MSPILSVVLRAAFPMGFGLVLLVTGCDRLLGLSHSNPPAADAPRPTTDLVQQQTASDANAWMLSASLGAPTTLGNVLVLIGATDRSNLESPTGGGVSTWTLAAVSTMYEGIEIWYGVTDGSSSTVTITCACTPTTFGNMRLLLTEWTGLATTNGLLETRGNASGITTSGVATSPSITTVDGPDLLIFGASTYGSIAADAMGTGTWTALDLTGAAQATQSVWYQLASEPGSYAGSVAVTGNWDAAIAAFRALPQ